MFLLIRHSPSLTLSVEPHKEIFSVIIFRQTGNKSGILVQLQLRFSEFIKILSMFSSVRSHVLQEKLCFIRKIIELAHYPAKLSHLSVYCLKGLYRDCFCLTVKFGQNQVDFRTFILNQTENLHGKQRAVQNPQQKLQHAKYAKIIAVAGNFNYCQFHFKYIKVHHRNHLQCSVKTRTE